MGHTAVWTGEELLIWGGDSGDLDSSFADGAGFDPATSAWRDLASTDLSSRTRHAAVWTGEEMIVWGGVGEPTESHAPLQRSDGAAYDPETDEWRPITEAPVSRSSPVAEVSDGFVVIAGGYSDKDSTPDFLVYSIIDDTWRTIETETTVHDMVRTDAGVLFALGGRADRGFELFTVDPSEGNVQRVPSPEIPGPGVSSAGIAATAGGGITVATSDGDTTTVVSAGPELKFDTPREVGSAFFHPPVDLVQAPLYPGQMREISGGLLVSVSNRGISAFRAEDGEAAYDSLLDLAGYCGNGGSVVITEAQILTWGGQTCTGEGGGTTNRGVRTVVG